MKTNVTAASVKETSKWQCLRHWMTTTILLFLVSITSVLRAQVTNIIYQDNFARTGPLDGSTPDTVNVPGANWFACNVPQLNAQPQTDGSELALTNVPGTTNGFYLNGFLPFTPQAGHIYYLSCNIKPLSGGTNWLALGFATHPLTNNFFSTYQCGSGWMGVRGSGLQINTWGSTSGTSTFTNAAGANFQTITVVLDTSINASSGAAAPLPQGNTQLGWQIRFYTNGVLVAGGNQTMQWGNYPVKYVGLGADQAQGYFQQFTLTDVRIRSGTPMIVEEPQNATAQQGQTATFWVGVTNDYPLATYQWMTNDGVGGPTNAVPGATNGYYTTPTLDTSYNGLNYSVAINNTLGSTSSAPAVLTVVSGPPTVYSAEKTSNLTSIVVAFSKAVDPVTGLNPANYSVTLNAGASSGVSVLSASYGSGSNNVILTTSTLNTNTGYYLKVQNVQDLYGSAMSGAASVPVLPAGLVLYLRADSGVVFDSSGSLVAQWRDQTTNANDVVQYFGLPTCGPNYLGPVVRPSIMTGAFANNQPALEFGSTIHWLAAPSTPSLASMLSNTTMYAVTRFTGASDEIVNKVWGNLPAPFDWDPSPNENVQYGNGVNNAPANGIGGLISQNTPYVLSSMISFPPISGVTNQFYFWLNGAVNYPLVNNIRPLTGNPPVFWDAGFPLWVGGRWDLVNPRMRGEIAEILLFNNALSGADRTNVDNYLGIKYFTFSIAQNLPPSVTTSNGFSVTYTFVASQGSVHGYGFQWQENGTNIPNATGSTYTTGILGPGDNGDTFDVIVTLPDGSTTNSITSTLTVLNEPPYVTTAGITIWSPTNIVVLFDEAVDPVTATVAANYSLNNGATVLSAAMGDAPNKVVLTTSPLTFTANPGFYSLTVQNVNDLFNNTIVTASTPVGLYPNAALWVRADTGVTTDAGTNSVSQWNDLSGNGNTLSTVSTQEPLLVTNANGNLAIHFVSLNTTNEMDGPLHSQSLAITGDMSIIAVINFANLASGTSGEIVSKTGLGGNKNIAAPYDYYEGAGATLYRGNGGSLGNGISYGNFTATSAPTTNAVHILVASDLGNTISHYIDGVNSGVGLLGNNYQAANNADSNQDLTIGARADGINRLTGDIYELIVASSSMTASDVTALNSYLAAKYNVVLSNLSPTNIVLSASGASLLLSWPVDHTGWELQSNSAGLTVSNAWFAVAGSTTTNQMTITPNTSQTNVFFRMVYPPR